MANVGKGKRHPDEGRPAKTPRGEPSRPHRVGATALAFPEAKKPAWAAQRARSRTEEPAAAVPLWEEVAALGWLRAMRRGDFATAWRLTDLMEAPRRAAHAAGRRAWSERRLRWDGTPFEGRKVVVRCLHGLGDTLQFARFVPWLQERAARVTVMAQPDLLALLKQEWGPLAVIDGWREPAPPDSQIEVEVMELAYAARADPRRLGAMVPYLRPRPPSGEKALALWMGGRRWEPGARRVGLVWASSAWDPARSIPLAELEPLAGCRGYEFFSFQQGPEREAVFRAPFPIWPLSHATEAIEDAARAMMAMDLMICVDGMPAHLAGALGRPVWLLLPKNADWRWMEAGTHSPWYPTMRLFRQEEAGQWGRVAQAVAGALRGR